MFAIIHSGIRFARHRAGSVAPAFALSLLPLILTAGGAIDFAHAKRVKAQLQGALDSAVLAGAKDGSANWAQTAQSLFQANISRLAGQSASASFSASGTTYSGNATATVPTNFLGIINMPSLDVGAKSAAVGGTAGDNSCLLALDKGAAVNSDGITLNGAPNVSLAGCTIKSNTSMTCNGHGGNAYQSMATGTVSGCSNPAHAAATPDIYASLASNISTVCGGAAPGATWTGGALPTSPNIVTISRGASPNIMSAAPSPCRARGI